MSSPNTRGDHDVITKHNGGEGMMKLKNLVYATLHSNPIQQQKTSNRMQELTWTVGPSYPPPKQGRLMEIECRNNYYSTSWEKSLIIQTGQRSRTLPHLRFPSWAPHDLWSTGTGLTEEKEEDHKCRCQRGWRLVNQRTYSLEPQSNSHSNKAAGDILIRFISSSSQEGLVPANCRPFTRSLSQPQTVLHKEFK